MEKNIIAKRRNPALYFICGAVICILSVGIFSLLAYQIGEGKADVQTYILLAIAALILAGGVYLAVYGIRVARAPSVLIYTERETVYLFSDWKWVSAKKNEVENIGIWENQNHFRSFNVGALQWNRTLQLRIRGRELIVRELVNAEEAMKKLMEWAKSV